MFPKQRCLRKCLLSEKGNRVYLDNIAMDAGDATRRLKGLLPPGWRIAAVRAQDREAGADLAVRVTAPDGRSTTWAFAIKDRIDPRDVQSMVAGLRAGRRGAHVVAAPFLSPRTRELLEEAGIAYLDLTGNARLVASRPGLFISRQGSDKSPTREDRRRLSLKGPKAGRVVRALCDTLPPIGVRALAMRTQTDPGYVSRLVEALAREALVKRDGRGPVREVDWRRLIRRWAEDYVLLGGGRSASYLAPRGAQAVLDRIGAAGFRYAVTSSFAASKMAPVAPPRLLMVYVDRRQVAAEVLELRPAEAGANVLLLSPFDSVVYERTWERDGIVFAAPSQVAVDLLTSPGRGPAEADALLAWMAENERAWRT